MGLKNSVSTAMSTEKLELTEVLKSQEAENEALRAWALGLQPSLSTY